MYFPINLTRLSCVGHVTTGLSVLRWLNWANILDLCKSCTLFATVWVFFQIPVVLLHSLQFPHCPPSVFCVCSPALVRVVLVRPGLQSQLWCCSLLVLCMCALGKACTLYTTVRYEKKTSLVQHSLENNLSPKSLQNHLLVWWCDSLWFSLWGFGKNRCSSALGLLQRGKFTGNNIFWKFGNMHITLSNSVSGSGLTFSLVVWNLWWHCSCFGLKSRLMVRFWSPFSNRPAAAFKNVK